MPHHFRRYLALAIVLVLATLTTAPAAPPAPTKESWQAIALRGQRIGYGHVVETRSEQEGQTLVSTTLRIHTAIKRFEGHLTLIIEQQTQEDLHGNLRSFTFRMDNPPSSRLEMTGRVEGKTLKLKTTAGGQTTESELAIPADLKSPVYHDRLMEESPLTEGKSHTLTGFDPQLASLVTIKLTQRGPAEFTRPGGKPERGSHVTVEYLSGIPGLSIDAYLDATGRGVLNESKLLGTATWTVTREEALQEIPDGIDLGLSALIKVDRLADAPRTRKVTYRVKLPGGLSDDLLPASDTQSLERVDDETVLLTVQSLRPGDITAASTSTPDARYLAATVLARGDDPEIVKLATQSVPETATPAEAAVALERAVHDWLTQKNMASNLASASEVVRSREGDCTEHAVLLAALLRAKKIPSRVVLGLVYWDQYSAFAGHAWTEAWLGDRWIPLDATQAEGGIGAAHIRLGETSLVDGDAGLISGSISTWRLLDKATIEARQIELQP